ncbi:hypothetical protein PRIC1_000439 [Phytophthora ramorum]|uniref:uncharacterized protein n=1 Tax=Phytophthora ramorum TaxID=164328 RepID=UPI0030B6FF2B|nr:hypothetical protein KRP23_7114 [Phytophthora ramorum]
MRWSPLVLLGLLFAILQCLACCHAKTIDYEALEKSWEVGDNDAELRTEGAEHYRQLADKSEDEAKALGPQMIFVTMKHGGDQRREPLPGVAARWKEMLWNGGIEVNIYEVAESKLLVGLQKGMFVNDVMRFLDQQRDVREYEWNGKTYSHSTKSTKLSHQNHRQKKTKKAHRKKAHHPQSKRSKLGHHVHMNGKQPRPKTPQPAFSEDTAQPKMTEPPQRSGPNDEL